MRRALIKPETSIYGHSTLSKLLFVLVALALCAERASSADGAPAVRQLGRVGSNRLKEVSGLAASRQNPGILWMHNDGDAQQLYAVHTSGRVVARVRLPAHITDLEDIAIGPGPDPGVDYLYLGDIGDNEQDRDEIRVFRLAEPKIQPGNSMQITANRVEQLRLTYPDDSYDAETLLVDPTTGDLFVVTKEKKRARLFVVRADQWKKGELATLEPAGKLKVKYISGGDISRDGKHIVLRRESRGWLWSRRDGERIEDALDRSPRQIPVRMKGQSLNGEAVALQPDGRGYYTVSEGQNEPIGWFQFDPKSLE
jgi:hypothetical protein